VYVTLEVRSRCNSSYPDTKVTRDFLCSFSVAFGPHPRMQNAKSPDANVHQIVSSDQVLSAAQFQPSPYCANASHGKRLLPRYSKN
jgi:hypothetical protein